MQLVRLVIARVNFDSIDEQMRKRKMTLDAINKGRSGFLKSLRRTKPRMPKYVIEAFKMTSMAELAAAIDLKYLSGLNSFLFEIGVKNFVNQCFIVDFSLFS